MADLDIPDDVIEAQRAYDAADARVQQVSASLPSAAAAAAAGEAVITDEERAALQDARDERLRLLEVLREHPWWKKAGDPLKAEAALRKSARERPVDDPASSPRRAEP